MLMPSHKITLIVNSKLNLQKEFIEAELNNSENETVLLDI